MSLKFELIESRFTYHPPKDKNQIANYQKIRDTAKEFAYTIVNISPLSEEQIIALKKLDEVVFWTNAAIARHS